MTAHLHSKSCATCANCIEGAFADDWCAAVSKPCDKAVEQNCGKERVEYVPRTPAYVDGAL